jgi:hypothetical protein
MEKENYIQEVAKEDETMRWKAYEKLPDEYREQVNKIKIFQEKTVLVEIALI